LVELLLRLANPDADPHPSTLNERSETIDAMGVEELVQQAMDHAVPAPATGVSR
jgi:hypothetical protein